MIDAVRYTGGLLFDRVMAGWDVTVLLADFSNLRPLEILGATPVDLEAGLEFQGHDLRPQAVAVAADLFETDTRIRSGLLDTLEGGRTEVTLWGERPTEIDSRIGMVEHRLSVAAKAFKAHALAAADLPDAVGAAEMFRSGDLLSCAEQGRADLVPA